MLVNFMSEEAPIAPMYRAFITEIIMRGDPRTEKFDEAKRKKNQGLIDRGHGELLPKRNFLTTRTFSEGDLSLLIWTREQMRKFGKRVSSFKGISIT
jgi:hypothetical protein